MSEPYGNNWKKVKVWPPIQRNNGASVDRIKINVSGLGTLGEQGAQGLTGPQGPQGNPNMQLTAPDGTIYQLTVTNTGTLGTQYISGPQGTGGASSTPI